MHRLPTPPDEPVDTHNKRSFGKVQNDCENSQSQLAKRIYAHPLESNIPSKDNKWPSKRLKKRTKLAHERTINLAKYRALQKRFLKYRLQNPPHIKSSDYVKISAETETLTLHISAQYQCDSWISASTWEPGTEIPFQYRNFKKVEVEIYAPDPDDPGQLLCLHQKSNNVVAWFRSVPPCRVAKLGIHFCTSPNGYWGGSYLAESPYEDQPQTSMWDKKQAEDEIIDWDCPDEYDFEALLDLFVLMPPADEVLIRIDGLVDYGSLLKDQEKFMMRPSEATRGQNMQWSEVGPLNEVIVDRIDSYNYRLQVEGLLGPTAKRMNEDTFLVETNSFLMNGFVLETNDKLSTKTL